MKSAWSDDDARALVSRYADEGVTTDVALRVYSTRLLGRDPTLVLHGGGNTSVKTRVTDPLGDEIDVMHIKGSGWDMAEIGPAGLPAVRLAPLRRLCALPELSDEEMVNQQRLNLLNASAPTPSVETLLHALLPHKFIDHTHASAVLAITDQPDGDTIAREVFGESMAYVPYVIPGFALARKVAQIYAANPEVDGAILLRHGIFTFAETARAAYELMIRMVTRAEERLRRAAGRLVSVGSGTSTARVTDVAPILRGACALSNDTARGIARRQVLCYRSSESILRYVNGAEVARYSQVGVATPDHVIRTKGRPLLVPAPASAGLDEWSAQVRGSVGRYVAEYHEYFRRNNARHGKTKVELDPYPRVVLVPGLGLFGLGASAREAAIAADIAEATVDVVTGAESLSRYQPVSPEDQFDVEYWSLEQAKLGNTREKRLARQVVLITGGGSGIGAATARAMAREGAEIAVADRDASAATRVAAEIGRHALAIACDVTDPASVTRAFDAVVEAFGGVDVVVSNAGAAWQGRIGEVDDAALRQSFELNFFAHQSVARHAVRVMRAQGTGGCLLFNASKQAVNPGKDFGPYGLPKASTLFLMKQYALDYGAEGIRSNAVNADRVRTGLLTDAMIAARAHARGMTAPEYLTGNLLRREVTAEDVAEAFVFLALARTTTASTVTVDGGNIEASLR